MSKVVHCKRESYEIYIGRPGYFGNPFAIGKDGTREEVCNKHYEWAKERMEKDETFKHAVLDIRGKTLGCYCSPLDCHGNNLVRLIEEFSE